MSTRTTSTAIPSSTPASAIASPLVSIIIPCCNEARHIETCLHQVLGFDAVPGDVEVIVADGMSDDGTRNIIAGIANDDRRVRMVDNPARVTSCGLNTAIRASTGQIIVRIDVHTEYAPDYLARCVETLQNTGADNVGGPWIARGQSYVQRAIAAAFASPFAVGGARGHRAAYEGPVDTVYLGCWQRSLFDEVGLFDEGQVRSQDAELNMRIQRHGGVIWQSPSIRSWYSPRRSLGGLCRQYFQYGYWKARFIRTYGAPASWRQLVPGAFVFVISLLLLGALLVPGLLVLAGALLTAYSALCLFAAVHCAIGASAKLLPVLPFVFACYHISYGVGFVRGAWDFLICRRSTGRYQALTR